MKILARVLAVSVLSSIGICAFAAPIVTETPVAMVTETVETQTYTPVSADVFDHPILVQLHLSNQQKADVNRIDQQYGSRRPLLNNQQRQILANLRHDRDNLVLDRNFDDRKAREVITQEQKIWAQQQQAIADFQFLKLKREHAIYQILTPYQQQQYLRLRQQQKDVRRK
ncbi:MAG: Spy/CpxP family protein refolding chaperone [Snodgrassella sp.]|nr:Spy/CpxP family protein refolding chaperone [Snodgrassella sp.]